MRQLLKPSGAIKIKIFSLDAQIIYSTDLQIIGLIDDKNMSLKKAIKGEITSDIQHRNSFVDLNNERKFDVDVVGTYLPMLDSSGQIKGVYEIYMDMTPYIKSGDKVIQTQIMSLGFILLVIFVLLNVLIFISTNKMLKLQSKLQHQATHDELTKISNRAYINERLKEELARVKRSDTTNKAYQTGLALIDIDYFKVFNDNHGHLLGDEILKAFATRLQDIMRQEDIVARYGGEEFIVILPNTDANELLVATKRIHEWLKSKPYIINGESYNIKTSIGVTQILTSDDSISSIIKRADKALYYVKEHGRDNVMRFSSNNAME